VACAERGLEPCWACRRGEEGLCQNVAEGNLAPGMIGYHRELPGGWGGYVLARPERLVEIPAAVPDARAVLAEPLAVALRGLRRAFGAGGQYDFPNEILIIGAGTIGLLSLALLRALGYAGRLDVIARHPLQAELARSLGASKVFPSADAALVNLGARAYKPLLGPVVYRGGYGGVVEAAGSATSLRQAAWAALEGGTVLLLGAAGEVRHDFPPHWFSELTWVGSYTYSAGDFADAVAMLGELEGLENLVAPPYALPDWRAAFTAIRSRRLIKAVFTPSDGS
jgi:L-gulonate 5-dehydrogenase